MFETTTLISFKECKQCHQLDLFPHLFPRANFEASVSPPNPGTPPLTSSAHLSFFNGKVLPKTREDEMKKNTTWIRHGLGILQANDLPFQSLSIWTRQNFLLGAFKYHRDDMFDDLILHKIHFRIWSPRRILSKGMPGSWMTVH